MTLNRILGLVTGVPTGFAGMIEALTPRERDVMAFLVRGLPTKTIGLELGISPRTVEIHRRRILLKMQTDNCGSTDPAAASGRSRHGVPAAEAVDRAVGAGGSARLGDLGQ